MLNLSYETSTLRALQIPTSKGIHQFFEIKEYCCLNDLFHFLKNFKESLPVTVQTYKLPKFEVELEVPTFVEVESPGFTVKVKAT